MVAFVSFCHAGLCCIFVAYVVPVPSEVSPGVLLKHLGSDNKNHQ